MRLKQQFCHGKMLMNTRIVLFLCATALWGQQAALAPRHPPEYGIGASETRVRVDTAPKFPDRHPRYEIEPGDALELTFSPSVEYNQTVTVQPDGYITLREIGDLYVRGKTVPDLRDAITSAYSKILHDPEITILLKDFDKPHFTATGQVGRPGRYDLRADTTVTEALAMAGGLTEKAKDSQVVLFRRVSDDWVETKLVDVKAVYKGRIAEDIHVRPGDLLFVPQNRFSKIKPFLPVWALSTYLSPAAGL